MSNTKRTRTRGAGGRFATQRGASAAEVAYALPDLRGSEQWGNQLPIYNQTFEAVFDETGARR